MDISWLIQIVILAPVVLLSLSVHEFAHGKVADMLGDPTPRFNGRLTLNPISHLDPFGLLALFMTRRIGWAKPVPINPTHFKDYRKGMMLVGMAGPGSNFILAILSALLYHGYIAGVNSLGWGITRYISMDIIQIVQFMIFNMVAINIGLGIFNLIPFPPLDGSKILGGILPERFNKVLAQLESGVGMVILIFLAVTGILGNIISPIIRVFLRLLRVY